MTPFSNHQGIKKFTPHLFIRTKLMKHKSLKVLPVASIDWYQGMLRDSYESQAGS